MKETWDELKKQRQEKRADNRVKSREILEKSGFEVEFHNFGMHLVVDGRVDFWPGTGRWIARGAKAHGFGVYSLIEWLGKNKREV